MALGGEREEPEEGDYKLFCWKMKFMSWCNNAGGFLAVTCIYLIAATFMSGGLMNINVTSLEQRFSLTSAQSGLVVVGFDISLCVFAMFVSYFGAQASRPKVVAVGAVVTGLGAFMYALPHFVTGPYDFGSGLLIPWCIQPGSAVSNATACTQSEDLSRYVGLLLFGTLLVGAGITPFYTLAISYIEDSVPKQSAAIYLGIFNAAAILGPIAGFLGGAQFLLKYFVDFDTTSSHGLTIFDARWVGAWWIGPLITFGVCVLTSVPLSGFPKQLPGTNKNRAKRISEVHKSGGAEIADRDDFAASFRDFPRAFIIVIRNPTFAILTLASCVQSFTINGGSAFVSKFLENEFHLTAARAGTLAGAVLVPAAVVGHLLSGAVIYALKLKTKGILMFCAIAVVVVSALIPVAFVHCGTVQMVGLTHKYSSSSELMVGNLTSTCNQHCAAKCQEEFYLPVCGSDNLTYFSACHAGCSAPNIVNGVLQNYSACSCINYQPGAPPKGSATPGPCQGECTTLAGFLVSQFFMVMCSFIPITGTMLVLLRVVPDKMRSFGLGVNALIVRGAGTIPGPLVYGAVVDITCRIWQTRRCDDTRGSCFLYDNRQLAIAFVSIGMAINVLAAMLYTLAAVVYKPAYPSSSEKNKETKKANKNGTAPVKINTTVSDNPVYEEDRL